MGFISEVHTIKTGVLIVLGGKILNTDSEQLKREFEKILLKSHNSVAIDISNITYIDSYGLGVFAYIHNRMQKEKRQLYFINCNPHSYIAKLFEMTRLNSIFHIVSKLSDVSFEKHLG